MTIMYMDGFDAIDDAPSPALRGAAMPCFSIDDLGLFPQPKQPEHPTPTIKPGLDVMQTKSGRVIYWNDTTYYRPDGSVMPMDEVDSILAEAKGDGAFDKINWDM